MPWPMLLLVAVLQTAAVPSSIETVSRGDMSGVEETREAVARTAGEWAALWREHAGATPTPFGNSSALYETSTSFIGKNWIGRMKRK